MADEPVIARGRAILPGSAPFIFGILNCTPDSFSDGGIHATPQDAIAAGLRMAQEGADVIDVGGESTRPGSQPVPPEEQIRRTQEVIMALARQLGPGGPALSIDTRSAQVARVALDAGATIINDISALRDDPDMAQLAADRSAGVILMHMQGTPATMQDNPRYGDVVAEIEQFLIQRIAFACAAGIARERLIVDPGISFGKKSSHNLEILRRLDEFQSLGLPVMIGASRKRFIAQMLGDTPEHRLWGTLGSIAVCVLAGVECLRVHDVAACRAVADMCAAIKGGHSS